MLEKNGVVNSEILNKVVDISFEKIHENSFQISFKDHSDSMQEELLFGQPSNGTKMTEYVEGCHAFYDPVAEYMDRFFSWGGWLCSHQNDQNALQLFFAIMLVCSDFT